jgi:deoxyribodipyrimidine photo-lyase
VLPDAAYLRDMPADVLQARTGIAAIDLAVRTLYAAGYLHNHARMWLASYLVHVRRVHWHSGAQWMLGYLLDGDVASNHLSWQWVAGTGSTKPYLFNADNVAKYAPEAWHSFGTVIDTSYEALDRVARNPSPVQQTGTAAASLQGIQPPALTATPPGDDWSVPDAAVVTGRDVWLQHPWSLGALPPPSLSGALVVGVGLTECHAQTPWSEGRWNFVREGLQAQTPCLWWAGAVQLAEALRGARSVHWQPEPHADAALRVLQALLQAQPQGPPLAAHPQPCLFTEVPPYCKSFSQWWRLTGIRG